MNEQIKILIVDNDLDFITVHSKGLIQVGYQVAWATSGKEAFENLASFFPDIVLLGICLSDMSGFDILSTIRSVNTDRPIFVIMMTDPGSAPPAPGGAADEYLQKPVTPGMLNARIKTMVRVKKAEHELRLTNTSLERLIQKQTSELKLSNAYLREEIKNLEKTQENLEQKISERTAQLESVNRELRDEIQVRKIAQEDIVRKEKHLNTSQKVAVLGSFFSRPDGSEMDFSDGFYELFGYASGEAVLDYELVKHHIFSTDRTRFEQDMESIYKTQDPIDAEYKIVLKNATIREIRLIATPVFDKEHIPVEIRGIFQDITQRKQMERQMIQNEKLASLGFLASGVAHEINNPNNFISFNIPILREYLGAILPIVDDHAEGKPDFELCNMGYDAFKKDLIKLADNIENGSARINKIVSNLRKFVYTKEQAENSRVNVQKVVQTCVDMVRAKVSNLVKHFEIDMADNLPEIETDSEILNIAVINLLINAAQACDKEDSRVRLSVAYDTRLKGSMEITVSDNGSGMDPETISRAFDPFFSTKPSDEGTGIGLSLVHNLVTSLGGQISVESEPGIGSTFTLRIPDLKKKG